MAILLQHFRQKYFGLLVATYILADGVSLVMGKIQVALGQTPPAAVQPAASQ
jgi:late competence protein required for DNA uptake (superfamily II DNA/RNA helicase)